MDTARLEALERLDPTDPEVRAALCRASARAGRDSGPGDRDYDRAEAVRESCCAQLAWALGRPVDEILGDEDLVGRLLHGYGPEDATPAAWEAACVATAVLVLGEDSLAAWRLAACCDLAGAPRDVATLIGAISAALGHSCGGVFGAGLSAAEMVAAQASRAWLRDQDRPFGGIPCWGRSVTLPPPPYNAWQPERRHSRVRRHPAIATNGPWHGDISHPEPGREILHHVTGSGRASITAWSSLGDDITLDTLRIDIEAGPLDRPERIEHPDDYRHGGRWVVSLVWMPADREVECDWPSEDLLSDRPDRAKILAILNGISDGALVADLRAAGYSWLPDAIESLEAWWAPADEPEGEP